MSADINVGAITEALNNKVDLVVGVPQDAVDYVVAMQRPTAENNYTWYRKYKSGWVEQGGFSGKGTTGLITISFLIEFSQIPTVVFGTISNTSDDSSRTFNMDNLTTTYFDGYTRFAGATSTGKTNTTSFYWQASGMAAA